MRHGDMISSSHGRDKLPWAAVTNKPEKDIVKINEMMAECCDKATSKYAVKIL
jgi:hypothetical protein